MTGDLFQQPSTANSAAPRSSSASSGVSNITTGFNFGSIDLESIIQQINLYSLVWSAFVSFVLVSNFYFYYRRHNDRELGRENIGKKSLWQASWVWLRYLIIWPLLLGYALSGDNLKFGLGIVLILCFIAKFWLDIRVLILSTDYFDWYKPIAKNLMRLIEFYKIPKKK